LAARGLALAEIQWETTVRRAVKLTVRVASQEEGAEYEKGIDPTRPSSDLMLIYLVEIDGIGDGLI